MPTRGPLFIARDFVVTFDAKSLLQAAANVAAAGQRYPKGALYLVATPLETWPTSPCEPSTCCNWPTSLLVKTPGSPGNSCGIWGWTRK